MLCIIQNDHPDLDHCPFLPNFISLVLHYASPSEALGMVRNILSISMKNNSWTYLPIGLKENTLFFHVFANVGAQSFPKLAQHLKTLKNWKEGWTELWQELFASFFVGHLPLPSIFRILDCFFLEGMKIFYRTGMGLLKIMENYLLTCPNIASVNQTLKRELSVSLNGRFDTLMKHGFSFKILRTGVIQMR